MKWKFFDEAGKAAANAVFLLPLWEKVARPEAVTDEGFPGSELVTTPHPSALRAATLSHKGEGSKRSLHRSLSSRCMDDGTSTGRSAGISRLRSRWAGMAR
ncbi:hypothetical protein BH11PSE4_BH11PSE4_15230 [soil metagenome]